MCSELATLAAFIAEKIGWKVKFVIGSVITGQDNWREAHAYVWLDDLGAILDLTAVTDINELPAIFMPTDGTTWNDMTQGSDATCKRIGTNHQEVFGLEAGGFGIRTKEDQA